VVGKFVEFFGPGVLELSLEDRATIANMSPEYGTTMGFFPVDEKSTYIKEPPILRRTTPEPEPVRDIQGARVLALLGDSVTTDHISPAGSIPAESPAGKYLIAQHISPPDFNSYGARRGNHEVMMRGTFANIRLKNRIFPLERN